MSEDHVPSNPTGNASDGSNANIIYILYLVGFVTGGITTLIGVVMAYINQGEAPDWVKSHYRFQIRTFWISILYSVVGSILIVALGLGLLILLFTVVWFIVRCIKGINAISRGEAISDPATWLW